MARVVAQRDAGDGAAVDVAPVPDVSGHGQPQEVVAHAGPGNVVIKGKTNAKFNGGSFHTENVVTEAGQGCMSCKGKNCVHVTGNLVTLYEVTTKVSLPSMAQFARLSPCQREAVRQAIENQLAPHEQAHVTAFGQYTGSSDQPFDLTTCRSALPKTINAMVRAEEKQRRADAQAASDALDPFTIDVDLDCTDDSKAP